MITAFYLISLFPTLSRASTRKAVFDCMESMIQIINKSHHITLVRYKKDFRTFTLFGKRSNKKFIKVANSNKSVNRLIYFHVENSFLKILNDKIVKDKNLTYAINVHYFELLYSLIENDAYLKSKVKLEYSDYKSLRMGFDYKDAADEVKIWNALARIQVQVNNELKQLMQGSEFNQLLSLYPKLLQDTDRWFIAGIGNTDAQAATVARVAKSFEKSLANPIIRYADFKKMLHERLVTIESLRKEIQNNYINYPSLLHESKVNGEYVPSIELNAMVRKIDFDNPKYLEIFQDEIRVTYRIEVQKHMLAKIIDYYRLVDTFSPAVYQEETIFFDFSRSKFGVVSVDIAKVGAKGLHQTMSHLVGIVDPDIAVQEARLGYEIVKTELENSQKYLMHSIGELNTHSEVDYDSQRIIASGDDLVWFPKSKLRDKDKVALLRLLQHSSNPSEYRLVFLPKKFEDEEVTIPSRYQSSLLVMGEELEKSIRDFTTKVMGATLLNKFGIGIDIKVHKEQIVFNIMIATRKNSFEEYEGVVTVAAENFFKNTSNLKIGKVIKVND